MNQPFAVVVPLLTGLMLAVGDVTIDAPGFASRRAELGCIGGGGGTLKACVDTPGSCDNGNQSGTPSCHPRSIGDKEPSLKLPLISPRLNGPDSIPFRLTYICIGLESTDHRVASDAIISITASAGKKIPESLNVDPAAKRKLLLGFPIDEICSSPTCLPCSSERWPDYC
jgi:hypothetical protein